MSDGMLDAVVCGDRSPVGCGCRDDDTAVSAPTVV